MGRKSKKRVRSVSVASESILLLAVAGERIVDELKVRRFSAEAGPVVDDLRGDLFRGVIEKDHR